MALMVPSASVEGHGFFLAKAFAMSTADARNVLNLETTGSDSYCRVWHWAEAIYRRKMERFPNKGWNRMPRECYIAVTCFTLDRLWISRHLNAWCRAAHPTASNWEQFPYKSLLCFLLRAFMMLPEFDVSPVYRAVQSMDETGTLLFTEFVSASVSFEPVFNYSATGDTYQALNSVPATLVRDISLYSAREDYEEVLIWPLCTFRVSRLSAHAFALDYCWKSFAYHVPRLPVHVQRWLPRTPSRLPHER